MRGGTSRLALMQSLETPRHRQELSEVTGIDWKEVDRELGALEKYGLVKVYAQSGSRCHTARLTDSSHRSSPISPAGNSARPVPRGPRCSGGQRDGQATTRNMGCHLPAPTRDTSDWAPFTKRGLKLPRPGFGPATAGLSTFMIVKYCPPMSLLGITLRDYFHSLSSHRYSLKASQAFNEAVMGFLTTH
jgi:hypothetical protein